MRRLLLPLVLAVAAGCATSGAFRSGENAERLQDYDRAVLEYQKAVKDAPQNVQYRRALERARRRAATDHANMGRRLAGRGQARRRNGRQGDLDHAGVALDVAGPLVAGRP